MKVTNIEKFKGTQYKVYIDDEYYACFDVEIIVQNKLEVGNEVDDDNLEELKYTAQRRKARERGYYLIGYRDHSKKELYDKLLKSAEPDVCNELIEMFESQGLLDDEKYAGKLARYYITSKNWGRKKAYYEMLKRGIDKEFINSALDEAEVEVDYIPIITKIIDKKHYDKIGDYKGRQKIIASLLRQGFNMTDIKLALDEYNNDDDDDDCDYYDDV